MLDLEKIINEQKEKIRELETKLSEKFSIEGEEVHLYLENILRTVRGSLLVLDEDLNIRLANPNFYRTFNVTPEETIGRPIYELGDGQWNIPKLKELLEEIIPEKESFEEFEVDHDFQGVGHKVMLLNARQIKGSDSKRILLAIEDITERKRLEELLTDSEEQYRRLFETASDGIVLLEKREGKITNVNPATEKMLGYTKTNSIGNKLQDIGVSLDTGDFQTTIQNLTRKGILNYRNVSVKTKSGQHIDTEIYLVDRAKLVQCNIRNITKRKQTEEALRREKERFRTLTEQSPFGMAILDKKDNIEYINPKFIELFGYKLTDTPDGKTFRRKIFPDKEYRYSVTEAWINDLKEYKLGETRPRVFTAKCNNGTEKIINFIPVQLTTGENLIVCEDITEREQSTQKIKRAFYSIVDVLASTVELRDSYTAGHQKRVSKLSAAIAEEMGYPISKIDLIKTAASIHDVGKMSIPAEILSKPGKFSKIEYSLIKTHPETSHELLKNVEFLWENFADIVYQHHERLDGSGYPQGLKGDQILPEAKIIAVADVVEAMASHRPYRASLGIDAALNEIETNKNTLYDAKVVDACVKLFREKDFHFSPVQLQ